MLTEEDIRLATKEVVFVARDAGVITRFWRNRPNEEHEALYEDDAEVQAFLARTP